MQVRSYIPRICKGKDSVELQYTASKMNMYSNMVSVLTSLKAVSKQIGVFIVIPKQN